MMRVSVFALLLPGLLGAAILPDAIGDWHRSGSTKPALTDQPVWNDYGLKDWESATYQNGAKKATVNVWKLQDTTGAMAAFDWQRPADAKPSTLGSLAAETPTGLVWVRGNYLLAFEGFKPEAADLDVVGGALKNLDSTSLPVLPGYLPSANLVPNSQRYVTGAGSLARFDPAISPSLAGFHFGAEAQLGTFRSAKGDMTLAIFKYPTPQIARLKVEEFTKAGAMARRSGPLVSVFTSPADPDLAERVLGDVHYQAEITVDEYVPTQRDNMGDLLLNICILAGLLAAFGLVAGFAFGGFRAMMRAFRKGEEPGAMITLHLEETSVSRHK